MIPPDHMPHLIIEAKAYASFPFQKLFSNCAILDAWISQAISSANAADLWLVAFKVDRLGWYVAMPDSPAWIRGNHALYASPYGTVIVASLIPFLTDNRDEILARSAAT